MLIDFESIPLPCPFAPCSAIARDVFNRFFKQEISVRNRSKNKAAKISRRQYILVRLEAEDAANTVVVFVTGRS